jgi:kynurenine formamidase
MKTNIRNKTLAVVFSGLTLGAGVAQFANADTQGREIGSQRARERNDRDRGDNGRIRNIAFNKIVSLQHVINPAIPIFPGDPVPAFNTVASIDPDGFFLRSLFIGEHSATHMNSGNSFFAGGTSIDSYKAEQLVRKAVVIDVRRQSVNPDYAVTKEDVLKWERTYGRIPRDSVVLVWTGYQDRWNDPASFFNEDAAGGLHFPGVLGATTEWLLAERQIAGIGIDTHGIDPGTDTNYLTNNAILKAEGIALECVANLDKLKPTGNTIVLGPLALEGGSGSPLSITAFVE